MYISSYTTVVWECIYVTIFLFSSFEFLCSPRFQQSIDSHSVKCKPLQGNKEPHLAHLLCPAQPGGRVTLWSHILIQASALER